MIFAANGDWAGIVETAGIAGICIGILLILSKVIVWQQKTIAKQHKLIGNDLKHIHNTLKELPCVDYECPRDTETESEDTVS